MKRVKHLKEREALDGKGFDSISSSGGRYKVWPKGKQEEAIYVTGEQLDDLSALTPKEIGRKLAQFARAARDGVDTLKLSLEGVEIVAPAKREEPGAAGGEGKGEKKKRERAERPPRASASAVAEALLARINASTDKSPVVHSKLENKSAKKIARQLWRDGRVRRVERDGQLVYLPLEAGGAKTAGPKKGGAKKGSTKKAEAKVTQPPAVASKTARSRKGSEKPAGKRR